MNIIRMFMEGAFDDMIKIYSLEEPEWDGIVKSFLNYDVYYLSGYVRAFFANGDGIPQLIYLSNGSTRAINVVMKRDLAENPFFKGEVDTGSYYDVVTPYGYGGFLIEGNDFESLSTEYIEYCTQNHIICEFVRFHPLLENWQQVFQLYNVIYQGNTVCVETSSIEAIWKNMTSKNRNVIRKAIKSGLKVFWERTPKIIEPFMGIYNATMQKDCAGEYYFFDRAFYDSILNDLKYNAMWFYAELSGEIAAIAVFLFCNGKMHYHLSASKPKYQSYAPTNLLLYEAAVWAALNGYSRLHLGGGVGAGYDSLYKFKKAFNRGEDLKFYIGKKIFDNEAYEKFVQIRREKDADFNENSSYFPLYRS